MGTLKNVNYVLSLTQFLVQIEGINNKYFNYKIDTSYPVEQFIKTPRTIYSDISLSFESGYGL